MEYEPSLYDLMASDLIDFSLWREYCFVFWIVPLGRKKREEVLCT